MSKELLLSEEENRYVIFPIKQEPIFVHLNINKLYLIYNKASEGGCQENRNH